MRPFRIAGLAACAALTVGAADLRELLESARAARTKHFDAAAQTAYESAFELALKEAFPRVGAVAIEAAGYFSEQKHMDMAESILKRALEEEDAAGVKQGTQIPVVMSLGDLYARERRSPDTAAMETRLVSEWEVQAGADSLVVANNLYRLGGTLEQTGNYAEAERRVQRALKIFETASGTDAPSAGLALERLADIAHKMGNEEAAAGARDRAAAIRKKYTAAAIRKKYTAAAYRVGGGVMAPRVVSKQDPAYSEGARKIKLQGSVTLSIVVDETGKPEGITVLLPLGGGLDEAAMQAVSAWRFSPGTKDGQPVPVMATVEVNFRLL
jgi:TonB family protein